MESADVILISVVSSLSSIEHLYNLIKKHRLPRTSALDDAW